MVIFNSYVKLPEGRWPFIVDSSHENQHNYGLDGHFEWENMGKLNMSMAMFDDYVSHYPRVSLVAGEKEWSIGQDSEREWVECC